MNATADDLVYRLFRYASSEQRAPMFLQMFEDAALADDRPIFWHVFSLAWPSFDDTWACQPALVAMLSAMGPSRRYLRGDDAKFHDSLPATLTIYRGHNADRLRGLSRTTDRRVARSFAIGHRGMLNEKPRISEISVSRDSLLFVSTEREESEVLIDPRQIRPRTVALESSEGRS